MRREYKLKTRKISYNTKFLLSRECFENFKELSINVKYSYNPSVILNGFEYKKFVNKYFNTQKRLIRAQHKFENNSKFSVSLVKFKRMECDDIFKTLFYFLIEKKLLGGICLLSSVITDFIEFCTNSDNPIYILNQAVAESNLKSYLFDLEGYTLKNTVTYSKNDGSIRKPIVIERSSDKDDSILLNFNFPMAMIPRPWLQIEDGNASYGGYLMNKMNINSITYVKHSNTKFKIKREYLAIINSLQSQPFLAQSLLGCIESHKLDKVKIELSITEHENTKYSNDWLKNTIKNDLFNQLEVKSRYIEAYTAFYEHCRNNYIKYIYFKKKVDFRGRIYDDTILSVVGDKILRKNLLNKNNQNFQEWDATASVLQILGTVTHSSKLMAITNVDSTKKSDPWVEIFDIKKYGDIIYDSDILKYQTIVDQYNFDNVAEVKKKPVINKIKETIHLITRDLIKFSIMRLVYGSNPFTISKNYKIEKGITISYLHVLLIIATFYKNYNFEFKCMKLLPKMNKFLLRHHFKGLTIENKFIKFENAYNKIEEVTLNFNSKTNIDNEVIKNSKNKIVKDKFEQKISRFEDKKEFHEKGYLIRRVIYYKNSPNEFDIKSSSLSVAPNFFHSIDSSVAIEISELFLKHNQNIITIHDAFLITKELVETLLLSYSVILDSKKHALINLINHFLEQTKKKVKNENNHEENLIAITNECDFIKKEILFRMENNPKSCQNYKFILKKEF